MSNRPKVPPSTKDRTKQNPKSAVKTANSRRSVTFWLDPELNDELETAFYLTRARKIKLKRSQFRETVLRLGLEQLERLNAAQEEWWLELDDEDEDE